MPANKCLATQLCRDMKLISTNWFSRLLEIYPDIASQCCEMGVTDVNTFCESLSVMGSEVEKLVTCFRIEQTTGEQLSATNIIDNLDVCPSWLLASPVSELNLSVRPTNVLGRAKIIYIGQLAELGSEGILNLRHMGRQSYIEICTRIVEFFHDFLCPQSVIECPSQIHERIDSTRGNTAGDTFKSGSSVNLQIHTHTRLVRTDWITKFLLNYPGEVDRLHQYGVVDDYTYQSLDPSLPKDLRLTLAHFRYAFYVDLNDSGEDVLDNLSFMPWWLLDSPISELRLSVRPNNVIGKAGIKTIADLRQYGSLGVIRLRNMGVGSYNEVISKIMTVFFRGTVRLHRSHEFAYCVTPIAQIQNPQLQEMDDCDNDVQQVDQLNSFCQCWDAIKQLCNDREWRIIEIRSGSERNSSQTLGEIGKILGISRERVRQIEASALIRICKSTEWKCITSRLCAMFESRTIPLEARFLKFEDEWFDGTELNYSVLEYIIANDKNTALSLLDLDGTSVIAVITLALWQELLNEGSLRLQTSELKSMKFADLYDHVTLEIRNLAPYLVDIYWLELTKNAVWTEINDGERIFLTTDTSVESLIHCVLDLSDNPMHYKAIWSLVNDLDCKKKYSEERIHNVLVDSFILYGTGSYGLPKHCPLSSDEVAILMSQLESIISRGPVEKQWHSDELRDRIVNSEVQYSSLITSHIISYVLSNSKNVVGLRRMVWGNSGQWKDNAEARIDVSSIVAGILLESGKPLTGHEIRVISAELRGLSKVFQVHSKSPIIQLGPGLWGLEGRDIDINAYESLAKEIYDRLNESKKPQHISFISEALPHDFVINFYALNVVCRRNGVRLDQAYYVSLMEWSGETNPLSSLLLQKLSQSVNGMRMSNLHSYLESTLGHPVDKQFLSSVLQHISATYDDETRLWHYR